jgi:membrane protease YdiL (CAAX protease family)
MRIFKRRLVLVSFLAILYYLPITLVWVGVIPFSFRFPLLVIMTALVGAYALARKRSLRELGLRIDNLIPSLLVNALLSLGLVAALFLLDRVGAIREPTVPQWSLFFAFYVLVSSPCQEFLFRSAVFAEMTAAGVGGAFAQIALSTVTYGYLHVIYNDGLTLGITLAMGIAWGLIYRRYPNLLGVALSHAVLGVISISLGLI